MSLEMEHIKERLKNSSIRLNIQSSKTNASSTNAHQVFLQQSVTLLALKNKTITNSTAAPNSSSPRLILGILPEDLPLFLGAIIGASLVIAVCAVILFIWKCCCKMTVLSKKKQYWLQPKSTSNIKGKYKIPVVQSNSVVFLGLKPSQAFEFKKDSTSEDCIITKFASNSVDESASFGNPVHYTMSENIPPEITVSVANGAFSCSDSLNTQQSCSVISASPLLGEDRQSSANVVQSEKDLVVPSVTVHRQSPELFCRNFSCSTFDQRSLYSCDSHLGFESEFKSCRFTWSNYSLRPTSTYDGYNDLFQKANLKRKNRMRTDIAAAIALNRSQSPQSNKDTDLLVENAIEVVSDERTTL